MNRDFDTAEIWVVTCPGPGDYHSLQIPKSLSGSRRIICRCGQTFGAEEARELVRKRDEKEKRPQ